MVMVPSITVLRCVCTFWVFVTVYMAVCEGTGMCQYVFVILFVLHVYL